MMMFFSAAGRDKNENEDVTSCMFLWEEITRCGGGAGEVGKNIRNCLLINTIKKVAHTNDLYYLSMEKKTF